MLVLFLVGTIAVRAVARRRQSLSRRLTSTRAQALGAPWRLVLPWALALACMHYVLTALRLEHMHIGPQRTGWVVWLYLAVVLVMGLATVIHYWRKHLRRAGIRPSLDYAALVLLAFVLEYRLFAWLARADIIA